MCETNYLAVQAHKTKYAVHFMQMQQLNELRTRILPQKKYSYCHYDAAIRCFVTYRSLLELVPLIFLAYIC